MQNPSFLFLCYRPHSDSTLTVSATVEELAFKARCREDTTILDLL